MPIRVEQLPADDILRSLPSIVDAKQRLTADVLVYCHDVMVLALKRLQAVCLVLDPDKLIPSLVSMAFADAWSIIDQIDLVRQAMNSTNDEKGPVTQAFLNDAAKVRKMRNGMDHVVARISNIATQKGACESLFGTLAFVKVSEATLAEANIGDDCAGDIVVIARGTVPGMKGSASTGFSTFDVDRPISNLSLSAAGETVFVDRMCHQLTDIIEGFSETVGASINAEVPGIMEQTGAAEEQVRAPTPTMIGTRQAIGFPFGPANAE